MPSLFLTRDFHLSLFWFSLNPRLISHHATSFFFFFGWFSLNPGSSLLFMAEPKNPSLSQHLDQVESAFLKSWCVILESAWSVFLAGVETREVGLLGWWSSDRLGWVLVAVLWWIQIRVSLIWFWVLIWFWDCVLFLQCEGGRGKESAASTVEEDDDEEGSGICVRGNEEVEPKVKL